MRCGTPAEEEMMASSDDRLGPVLAEVLRLPLAAVDDDLAMKDTSTWDSLTHMELIAALESTYSIEFTFDEIVAMTTVGAIRHILTEKGIVV